MLRRRRRSYAILWVGLILSVAILCLFGKLKNMNGERTMDETSTASSRAEYIAEGINESQENKADQKERSAAEPEALGEAKLVSQMDTELIGLWVPFMSLSTDEKTEKAFQDNFLEIVKQAKAVGVNALFVHVRPYCDALYPSEYFPWSHVLTGTQGTDPGFDPLKYMVEAAHENDMEFHAWINPLRVKTSDTPQVLSDKNPYAELSAEYPFYFMEYEGAVYLNPAYPYIRGLIANGAAEIVRNYAVDGIHFDDYFYPSAEEALDSASYASYKSEVETPISLSEWRTANVNAMVASVYEAVKHENEAVVFGISPAGNIESDLEMNADVAAWCATKGYIDYICPQLYYSYDNPALGYGAALDRWLALERHNDLKLYVGLALYKAGSDRDEGTWLNDDDIIARQIKEARAALCNGIVLYSSDFLQTEATEKEVKNAMAEILRPPEDQLGDE